MSHVHLPVRSRLCCALAVAKTLLGFGDVGPRQRHGPDLLGQLDLKHHETHVAE